MKPKSPSSFLHSLWDGIRLWFDSYAVKKFDNPLKDNKIHWMRILRLMEHLGWVWDLKEVTPKSSINPLSENSPQPKPDKRP